MENQNTSPATDLPWTAEPSGDGFYRVVNARSIVLAEKCVEEEARLFAASGRLLTAAHLALEALDQIKCGYEMVQHQAYLTLAEIIQEVEGA